MIHLTRIDPSRNMARFYAMQITSSLFGDALLVIEHGRIGGGSRLRSLAFADSNRAEAELARRLYRKQRRGYR